MSKPASWTAKDAGLPEWVVTALENLERERSEARTFGEDAARRYNELLADKTAEAKILRCAFCDMEYPPDTPPTQHEALTEHVKVCPAHPMRAVEADLATARERIASLEHEAEEHVCTWDAGFDEGWMKREAHLARLDSARAILEEAREEARGYVYQAGSPREQLRMALLARIDSWLAGGEKAAHSGKCEDCGAPLAPPAVRCSLCALADQSYGGSRE